MKETSLELKKAPDGLNLMPDCAGAIDELEKLVYEKAAERYGDILPNEVAARISKELDLIPSDVFAKYMLMNAKLVASEIFSDGKRFCRGTADNSFINNLLGVSNLNPLGKEFGGYDLEPEFFYGVEKKRIAPNLEIVCQPSKVDQVEDAIRALPWVKDVLLASNYGDESPLHKYLVIAEGVDADDLPVITLDSGQRVLGYDVYTIDSEKLLVCNIIGINRLDILADLEERTHASSVDIDHEDSKVSELLMSGDDGFSSFFDPDSKEYLDTMTNQINIRNVEDLTTVFALMCDTNVWYENLDELMKGGVIVQDDIIATREQCFRYLRKNGIGSEDAFRITESIRKGRGISDDDKKLLEMSGIPEWFIGFVGKVKYMFPEGHAINYAKAIWEQAYFKEYFPEEYGVA